MVVASMLLPVLSAAVMMMLRLRQRDAGTDSRDAVGARLFDRKRKMSGQQRLQAANDRIAVRPQRDQRAEDHIPRRTADTVKPNDFHKSKILNLFTVTPDIRKVKPSAWPRSLKRDANLPDSAAAPSRAESRDISTLRIAESHWNSFRSSSNVPISIEARIRRIRFRK